MRRLGNLVRSVKQATDACNTVRQASTATDAATQSSFWSQHKLKDLEDSSPDLELARRHNASFPYVKDQLVVGKIVRVDRDHVTVYTGHKGFNAFNKKELHVSQLVKSTDKSIRQGPRDFRVGDVMHFVLDDLQTPFGDMSLRVNKTLENERQEAVWKEICRAFEKGEIIKGRILNPINAGYVVGVAGYTGFLPRSMVGILTASRIGMLQDFLVKSFSEKTRGFVLMDAQVEAQRHQQIMERKEQQMKRLERIKSSFANRDKDLKNKAKQKLPHLERGHVAGVSDLIGIWRLNKRIYSDQPFTTGPPELEKLHKYFAMGFSRFEGQTMPASAAMKVLEECRGSAVDDLVTDIKQSLKSWNIEVPRK